MQASVSKRMSVSEGLSVCVCVCADVKLDVSSSMNEAKNHRQGKVLVIAIESNMTHSNACVAGRHCRC